MHFEHILDEIENTLDKLIENATFMKEKAHLKEQVLHLQKTQEDLLKNLHSMNAFLEKNKHGLKMPKEKKVNISKKLASFEKLNMNFIKNVSKNTRLIKGKKKNNS